MLPNQQSSNPFDFLNNPGVSKPQIVYNSNKNFLTPKKLLIFLTLLILIAVGGYFIFNRVNPLNNQKISSLSPQTPFINNQPIAKVGQEIIYESDLNTELTNYPPTKSISERQKILLEKIATDSAILQGAKDSGIITTLDPNIFNSPNKNYSERIKLIEDIKTKIASQSNRISGTIVAIWFYNFGKEGSLGYENGKRFAFDKITKLQQDVKSNRLTVDQAVEAIKNDSTLSQIDLQYKTNARYDFNVNKGEIIVPQKNINDALWNLNQGQTSDVYLETEPGFDKPGFYQFGFVKEKNNNSPINGLESWIEQQRQKYVLTIN